MSIKKSVPDEIIGLLEKGGYSIHIKGLAGTGKTSFALQVVKNVSSNGTVIYLSTRVTPDRVLVQFPWVREFLDAQNILDAKRSYITPDVPKRLLFEYTDQPEFIRSINEKIQTAECRPVTVIIDSLDALKSNLNLDDKDNTIETILLEIGEKTDSNMLFITETDEPCKLDYLVDGVIRLEREIIDDRLLRKLYFEKIRGGQMDQPYYLFTLKGSLFTSFAPQLFPRIKYVAGPEPEEQRSALIPTSIKEVDNALKGGLRKGTLNLIKTSREMGTEYFYILYPIIWSFIQKGFPVFMIPSQSSTTKLTMDYMVSLLGVGKDESIISKLRQYLYFFQFSDTTEKTPWNEISVSREDITNFSKVFRESVNEIKEKLGVENFLWFLGVDTMERIYGEEIFEKTIGTIVLESSFLNGIILALAKQGIKSMDPLIHLASTQFVMENKGALTIYGEFPKTKIYAIATDTTTEGNNKIELESIE
ncbi:MAG: gas vesicle protein GvpD P-loop domain-containing protein [Candidatus Freyarchaeum deiterrae]